MVHAIWSYNNGSKGGRLLAQALGVRLIRKAGSRFNWGAHKTVLNWGGGFIPPQARSRVLNRPDAVNLGRCKLQSFRRWRQGGRVRIPDFTDSLQEALGWLRTGDICCRATTTGHEGIGLSIVPRGSEGLPRVPLYVKYIKKQSEWRVHVVNGRAIHVQQKLRRLGFVGGNDVRIRNTANGYVFSSARQAPGDVVAQGIAAVQDLGLDFGAVDVIWNERAGLAYVLEVNTAPGIEGVTVERYRDAFRQNYGEPRGQIRQAPPMRDMRLVRGDNGNDLLRRLWLQGGR